MKKIILLLIDSMMPQALQEGLGQNKLPTFKKIMARGSFNKNCLSVFPTMSASFDASFATGVNPDSHGIPGLVWYDHFENRIVNYGNTPIGVWKTGIAKFIDDILYHQNEKHLSTKVTTIYEDLEKLSLSSGVFGYQLFRANCYHEVKLPWYIRLILRKSQMNNIKGPDQLILGKFVNSLGHKIPGPQSILTRGGVNDRYVINSLIETLKGGKQPDFSLLYLPTTDLHVHKNHLQGGIQGLIEVDSLLDKLLLTFGSYNDAFKNNIFILTGDHSQTPVNELIYLDKLLKNFKFPRLKETITSDHDLVIANNERMTYLYYHNTNMAEKILEQLKEDNRIDIISIVTNEWIRVLSGVVKGELFFKKGTEFLDEFGNSWDIKGDLALLDVKKKGNSISFNTYPDAFSMLESAHTCTSGKTIIITAKPGYMFKSESSPNFKGGGSHGSLHASEMLVPFLISEKIDIPLPRKLTETKDFIIQLFKNS